MCACVCVCVCVCVCPWAIKDDSCGIINQTSPTAFQFLCTALAIDTIDEHGLSNEACHELLPKNAVFAVHYTVKAV